MSSLLRRTSSIAALARRILPSHPFLASLPSRTRLTHTTTISGSSSSSRSGSGNGGSSGGGGVKATLASIKQLRAISGCGIADCKKALETVMTERLTEPVTETSHLQAALDWLRKQGIMNAGKKTHRSTDEGVIVIVTTAMPSAVVEESPRAVVEESPRAVVEERPSPIALIMEINCETDFVAKTEVFKAFTVDAATALMNHFTVQHSSSIIHHPSSVIHHTQESVDTLLPRLTLNNKSISDLLAETIGVLGENIKIKKYHFLKGEGGGEGGTEGSVIGCYMHGAMEVKHSSSIIHHPSSTPSIFIGSRGCIVLINKVPIHPSSIIHHPSSAPLSPLSLPRLLAMHCVAATPKYISPSHVPAPVIDMEKQIIIDQLSNVPSSTTQLPIKKDNQKHVSKIIDGKLIKFYSDVCLSQQRLLLDASNSTIATVMTQIWGPSATVGDFIVYAKGETML